MHSFQEVYPNIGKAMYLSATTHLTSDSWNSGDSEYRFSTPGTTQLFDMALEFVEYFPKWLELISTAFEAKQTPRQVSGLFTMEDEMADPFGEIRRPSSVVIACGSSKLI